MNKQEVLNALGQILSNNLGSKLSVELANGIIASLAQSIPEPEPKDDADAH